MVLPWTVYAAGMPPPLLRGLPKLPVRCFPLCSLLRRSRIAFSGLAYKLPQDAGDTRPIPYEVASGSLDMTSATESYVLASAKAASAPGEPIASRYWDGAIPTRRWNVRVK